MSGQNCLVRNDGSGKKSTLALVVSARSLPTDAVVVGLWHGEKIVGHSNVTEGPANPKFTTPFSVDYFEEEDLMLKWCIYQVKDSNKVDADGFVGSVEINVKDVMAARGGSKEYPLTCKGANIAPTLRFSISGGPGGKKKEKKEKVDKGPVLTKEVKEALKEGGKKGQDLCGMSTFGVYFFCAAMESPGGDMALMEKCMEGMNKEIDPEADDRKGGAGDLGKLLCSAGDKQVALCLHVPKEVQGKGATLKEWMETVCAPINGKIVAEDEFMCTAVALGDPEADQFPLKMRDTAIAASFGYLRSKGLVLDDESDDDINFADECGIDLNASADAQDY